MARDPVHTNVHLVFGGSENDSELSLRSYALNGHSCHPGVSRVLNVSMNTDLTGWTSVELDLDVASTDPMSTFDINTFFNKLSHISWITDPISQTESFCMRLGETITVKDNNFGILLNDASEEKLKEYALRKEGRKVIKEDPKQKSWARTMFKKGLSL